MKFESRKDVDELWNTKLFPTLEGSMFYYLILGIQHPVKFPESACMSFKCFILFLNKRSLTEIVPKILYDGWFEFCFEGWDLML